MLIDDREVGWFEAPEDSAPTEARAATKKRSPGIVQQFSEWVDNLIRRPF